jgi:hypothetical protein
MIAASSCSGIAGGASGNSLKRGQSAADAVDPISRASGVVRTCDTSEAVGRLRATLAPFRVEGSLQAPRSSRA